MPGEVVHFEIPADNVERARKFYKQAFGWQINPMPEMNYTMLGTAPSDKNGMPTKPGMINGGMTARQDPVRAPVVTISVADIDASLKTIEKSGGSVVRKKTAVGDMGWTAYFRDSEGNVMGLWQSARM